MGNITLQMLWTVVSPFMRVRWGEIFMNHLNDESIVTTSENKVETLPSDIQQAI